MQLKTGSCLCNAIKYTVNLDDHLKSYNCHCIDCRKKNGGAFVTIIALREGALKIDQKKLDIFTHPGKSGKKIVKYSCKTCAAPVYSYVEKFGTVYLYAGLLDDVSNVKSSINIHFLESHFPFLDIEDNNINI